MGKGYLKVQTVAAGGAVLVENVSVIITDESNSIIYELYTDEGGNTPAVALEAPDKWHNISPEAPGPHYSKYNVWVQKDGYRTLFYEGILILDTSTTLQKVHMEPLPEGRERTTSDIKYVVVGEHGLTQQEEREETEPVPLARVLPEVIIPEYITVHLARPEISAENVRVLFKDYIKNAAFYELYDHWPREALIANIYCIISLTLNRVYTEFYRTRGYDFDITNSTGIDQEFRDDGCTGGQISDIVDEIFNEYLAVTGHKEPFLALYCDGYLAICPGRLHQWDSMYDAENGMNAWQIINKYFNYDLELRECTRFSGEIESYPGYVLAEGSQGEPVRVMQEQLNRILGRYTNLLILPADGYFGATTARSVREFQNIYNMGVTGAIDKATWYKISYIYAIEKALWEMDSEGERLGIGRIPPTAVISEGSTGYLVTELQFLLNYIGLYYDEIPVVAESSRFDTTTKAAVMAFQRRFGLDPDGAVGRLTWNALYDVYWGIQENVVIPPEPGPGPEPNPNPTPEIPAYPGYILKVGSTGQDVRLVQEAINGLADVYSGLWKIGVDGQYGSGTRDAVMAFQRIFGLQMDGQVGPVTWNKLMEEYYAGYYPSEPEPEPNPNPVPEIPAYPGYILKSGSVGQDVRQVQEAINGLAGTTSGLWRIVVDGQYGSGTRDAVMAFQRIYGLQIDGQVGPMTWNRLMEAYYGQGGYSRIQSVPNKDFGNNQMAQMMNALLITMLTGRI